MVFRSQKKYSPEEALPILMRYCAKQDRCHFEVNEKLKGWEIFGQEADRIIDQLVDQRFLDEQRYANSFVRGKFRIKRWGRRKIAEHLKRKRVPEFMVRKALGTLNQVDYRETLRELLLKKAALTQYESDLEKRNKLGQYVIRKGYEPDLVWAVISDLF